jgi:hypothetical protein
MDAPTLPSLSMCCVCGTDSARGTRCVTPISNGACAAPPTNAHFTCSECVSGIVSADAVLVRNLRGLFPCPHRTPVDNGGRPRFDTCSGQLPVATLLQLLDAPSLSALTEAMLNALHVADLESERLRAELREAASEAAGGRKVSGLSSLQRGELAEALSKLPVADADDDDDVEAAAARERVTFQLLVDWFCILRCPRCRLPFADKSACDSLTCTDSDGGRGGCGAHFCAICLDPFPTHRACEIHVAQADHLGVGIFSEEKFQQHHRERARKALKAAVDSLREEPAFKSRLWARIEAHLEPHAAADARPWNCASCGFRNEAGVTLCGGCAEDVVGNVDDGAAHAAPALRAAPRGHDWGGQGQLLGGENVDIRAARDRILERMQLLERLYDLPPAVPFIQAEERVAPALPGTRGIASLFSSAATASQPPVVPFSGTGHVLGSAQAHLVPAGGGAASAAAADIGHVLGSAAQHLVPAGGGAGGGFSGSDTAPVVDPPSVSAPLNRLVRGLKLQKIDRAGAAAAASIRALCKNVLDDPTDPARRRIPWGGENPAFKSVSLSATGFPLLQLAGWKLSGSAQGQFLEIANESAELLAKIVEHLDASNFP